MVILAITHVMLDMKYSLNGINSRMKTTGKGVSKLGRRSIKITQLRREGKVFGKM